MPADPRGQVLRVKLLAKLMTAKALADSNASRPGYPIELVLRDHFAEAAKLAAKLTDTLVPIFNLFGTRPDKEAASFYSRVSVLFNELKRVHLTMAAPVLTREWGESAVKRLQREAAGFSPRKAGSSISVSNKASAELEHSAGVTKLAAGMGGQRDEELDVDDPALDLRGTAGSVSFGSSFFGWLKAKLRGTAAVRSTYFETNEHEPEDMRRLLQNERANRSPARFAAPRSHRFKAWLQKTKGRLLKWMGRSPAAAPELTYLSDKKIAKGSNLTKLHWVAGTLGPEYKELVAGAYPEIWNSLERQRVLSQSERAVQAPLGHIPPSVNHGDSEARSLYHRERQSVGTIPDFQEALQLFRPYEKDVRLPDARDDARAYYGDRVPATFHDDIVHPSARRLEEVAGHVEAIRRIYLEVFLPDAHTLLAKPEKSLKKMMPGEYGELKRQRADAFTSISHYVWPKGYSRGVLDALDNPQRFVAESYSNLSMALAHAGMRLSILKHELESGNENPESKEVILLANRRYREARELLDKSYLPIAQREALSQGAFHAKAEVRRTISRADPGLEASPAGLAIPSDGGEATPSSVYGHLTARAGIARGPAAPRQPQAAAASHSEELERTGAVPQSALPLEADLIEARSGLNVCLSHGRVLVWDSTRHVWNATQLRDAVRVRLGGDGHAYALTAGGDLYLLQMSGSVVAQRPLLRERSAGLRDFAVSPAGSVVELSASGRQLSWRPRTASAAHGPACALPLPGDVELRSVAFDVDGGLYALDGAGQIWRAPFQALRHHGDPAEWQRVEMQIRAAAGATVALKSLRNGKVGCVDSGGAQYQPPVTGTRWVPVGTGTYRELDRWFASYQRERLDNTRRTILGIPGPEAGRGWTPEFLRRHPGLDHPGESRSRRYSNWWRSHLLPHFPHPARQRRVASRVTDSSDASTAADAAGDLKQQFRTVRHCLFAMGRPTPMSTEVGSALHQRVTSNAEEALARLEQELRRGEAARRVSAPPAKVRSDSNALWVLYMRRLALYARSGGPAEHGVNERLAALIREGIFLDIKGGRRIALGRHANLEMRLHWAKNKYHVLTAKMLHDQCVLETATRDAAWRPDDAERMCQEALQTIDGGPGNLVSQLFHQGAVNVDRAKKNLENIESISSGLARYGHPLNRALTMGGRVRNVENFIDRVLEMAAGESITLKYGRAGGLDFDGLGFTFQMSDRGVQGLPSGKLNVDFNLIPNVQPVPTAMVAKERGLSISCHETGIELSFNQMLDMDLKPLAVKLMWGLGYAFHVGPVASIVYGGFELLPGVSIKLHSDNTLGMRIEHDDDGRVRKILRDVFAGVITPRRLLEQGVAMRESRGRETSVRANADVNLLVAGVGILGQQNQAKLVVAGLEQGNLEWKTAWGRSNERSGDGTTSTHLRKTETTVAHAEILVTEAQHSRVYDTLNPQQPSETIHNAAEVQSKLPTGIYVRQHLLWGSSLVSEGTSIHRDAQGEITGVETLMRSSYAPVGKHAQKLGMKNFGNRIGKSFNETNLPPLKALQEELPALSAYIQKIQDARFPIMTVLELTPEGINTLKGLDQSDAVERVRELAKSSQQWRIKEIKVEGAYGYKTGAFLGLAALRYRSSAQNLLTSSLAKVTIHRGQHADGAPSFTASGELLEGLIAGPDLNKLRQMHESAERSA